MSPQVSGPVRPIALIGMLLVSTAGFGLDAQAAATAECLTAPKAHTPKGGHWYYHLDRATKRKCWYLRVPSKTAGAATAAPEADAAAAAPAAQTPQPTATTTPAASASASASASAKQDADSVWSAPPANLQSLMSANGVHDDRQTGRAAKRTAPAEMPAPATSQAPTVSAAAPQGGGNQAAETTGASDREPQVRPMVTDAAKTIAPALRARAASANVSPSPHNRRASVSATGTAPANDATASEPKTGQSKNISQTVTDSASTPLGIVLIVALALVLTGILYRILLKLLGMAGPRVIIDRSANDWSEERYAEASTVPRQQAAEEPAPPLAPPVAEMRFRYPRVIGDGRLREQPGSRVVPARPNGEHDERLAALMRDLDQLLLRTRIDK